MTKALSAEELGELTSLIYASVLDHAKWQEFLICLSRVTGGVRTHLFGFDMRANISLGVIGAGYDPDYLVSFRQYYAGINPWAIGFSKADPGEVVPIQRMYEEERLYRTEFYADWARPQENLLSGGGALIFKDAGRMFAFGGNIRQKDGDKLEDNWLRTVGLLIPHLQRSFEMARIFSALSVQDNRLGERQADQATVLLVSDARLLLYSNAAGQELIEDGEVLRVDHSGRLSFRRQMADSALERVLRGLRSAAEDAACTLPISDGAEGRYVVQMSRFDASAHKVSPFPLVFMSELPCALVTISRPVETATGEFLRMYGLTQAEAELAYGLADGATLSELAEKRGTSLHTVRGQFKSAMSKMDVHRQVDVVRIIEAQRRRR